MEDVKWTAHIEVLSPLHIGTGSYLLEEIDWVRHSDSIWVVNQDALLGAAFERAGQEARGDAAVAQAIAGMTLSDLLRAGYLTDQDFSPNSRLFRYRLRGQPATHRIHEQVKDVRGRPYLPGSSLKGALRTVLAVGGREALGKDVVGPVIAELDRVQRLRKQGKTAQARREEAARPLEEEILAPGIPKEKGREKPEPPHYDLLRALQVGDSEPVGPEHLTLVQVHVYPTAGRSGGQRGLIVDVEALRPGTVLRMPVKVVGYLFTPQAEERLHFGDRRGWLTAFPEWARAQARARIAAETEYFQKHACAPAVAFYTRLARLAESLGEDEFLLQIAWGGGWLSKTFGRPLQADPVAFERIVREYRMTRERNRRPGAPFPRTRRLALERGQPALPLGWVKVHLENA